MQRILLGVMLLACGGSFFLVIVTSIVFRKKNSASLLSENKNFPPISILKPLRGEDPGLEQNLEAFFTQDYPEYELNFACEQRDDPALKILEKLQKRYPGVTVKIVTGATQFGYNPKVNNLIRASSKAHFEYILTSDSDVRPPSDYLRTIAGELLENEHKLVVNPICGTGDNSLGSILENLHLNSLILSGMAFLTWYRKKLGGFGKSMFFRRSDLEKIGGFEGLKNYFAEDYVLADRISKLPGKYHISRLILPCITSQRTFQQFINRHGRWAQTRRRIAGWSYFSELFANPIFWGLLYSAINLFSWTSLKLFIAVFLFKIILDAFQGITIANNKNLTGYILVPFKDLLVASMWFYPMLTDTVYWRGVRLRVTAGTELKEAGRRKILGIRFPQFSVRKWLSHSGSE